MAYAVPRLLFQHGRLARLYTDICGIPAAGWIAKCLPRELRPRLLMALARRAPEGVPRQLISTFPKLGCLYALRLRAAGTTEEKLAVHNWIGAAFCRAIIKHGLTERGAVYAFNSAAYELFCFAHTRGLRTCLEQIIAPLRIEMELMAPEVEAFPQWETGVAGGYFAQQFMEREQKEWELADVIVCGSEFVRDGIQRCGGPVEKCVVVPYGVDTAVAAGPSARLRPAYNGRRPLHVLTVGAVGLRKGSPYVMEVARRIAEGAHFRMVGPLSVPRHVACALADHVQLLGPLSAPEVAREYGWADTFVLPSICEGSARAVYEALSHGLPVICTPNTGSIVRDGIDGFVVPVRNAGAIVNALTALIHDPARLARMSEAARQRAQEFSISAYGRRLLETLKPVLG